MFPVSTGSTYEAQAVAADKITSRTSDIRIIPRAVVFIQVDPDTQAISLGEVLTAGNLFSVAWNSIFRGQTQVEKAPAAALDVLNLSYFRSRIQTGIINCGTVPPNSYRDFEVKFNPPFTSQPNVVTTLSNETVSFNYHFISMVIVKRDVNGFTMRFFNAHTAEFLPWVAWIAISGE